MRCSLSMVCVLVSGVVILAGCSKSPTAPSPPPAVTVSSVAVAGTNAIEVGANTQLTATATFSDGSTRNVTTTATWQSSNQAVATVSAGRVSAVSAGTATISAALDGRSGQLGVTANAVDNLQRVSIQVTNIVIDGACDDNSIFEDSKDGEFEFQFTVTPSGAGTTTILGTGRRELGMGPHTFAAGTSFTRNVTQGQDFRFEFTGSEFDGLLGADPRLNGRLVGRVYLYSSGRWAPDSRSLTVGSGSCGATINFTITSSAL